MEKYYHIYQSPIGALEICTDEEALLSVHFVQTERNGVRTQAQLSEADVNEIMIKTVLQLDLYFEGHLQVFSLPMAQSGTPFQQKVWTSLNDIPYGTTTSYLKQSRSLGDEKAIRAVASANGKNAIAIIVPCHRIIGSDGSMTGYAGDLWRKKWLHELEGAIQKEQVLTLF